MPKKHDPSPDTRAMLTHQDLISLEPFLREALARFVKFEAVSLAFPPSPPGESLRAEHLPGERRLLVPLRLRGRFLGLLVARGVRLKAPRTTTEKLPFIMEMVLENLLLAKLGRTDPETDMAGREHLLDLIRAEVQAVQAFLIPASESQESLVDWRGGFGCLYLDLGLDALVNRWGPLRADHALRRLAHELADQAPEQAIAGRAADHGLALLAPEAGAKTMSRMATQCVQRLSRLVLEHEITAETLKIEVHGGFTLYPRDMEGPHLEQPPAEQARRMILRAQEAALAAKALHKPVLGFGQMLDQGGRVLSLLPMDRLEVSLGRRAGAREGQRFQVLQHGQSSPKAEIRLTSVSERSSLAETLHLTADPATGIQPGDGLVLLPETANGEDTDMAPSKEKDNLGLHSYRYFLERFNQEAGKVFTLSLVRLPVAAADTDQGQEALHKAIRLAQDMFGPRTLLGRYSGNGFAAFHPGLERQQAIDLYKEYVAKLASDNISATPTAGLYCHPFLDYSKADALEGVRKALDYALLLPEPRVGAIDSLALTISADRFFSQEDLYSALEEYKAALLADEDNALARTSMAVALAKVGRPAEARRELENVLAKDKTNLNAWYNLGYVLQKLGETAAARLAYQSCQKIKPGHLFSLLRLGQMSEQTGRLAQARKYFQRVLDDPEGKRLAHRHMGRVCLAQGNTEDARMHLHKAITCSPGDAAACHLLACIYLDEGEDPGIAESLARQSVSLKPENKDYWATLARALEAGGKKEEAKEARGKG